ncbi:hypothetical protein AB0D60_11990 [Streptomyces sp. NPDC048306]|uniref:hypothetical protein n=1 Tax=Streptomyces sp. NPDC048306 TaxID=3154502 RepID=UPI0033F9F99B
MTDTALLTGRETNRLVTVLRHGRALDLAAADLGLSLTAVWATARTDTRLTIALAGRDQAPPGPDERRGAAEDRPREAGIPHITGSFGETLRENGKIIEAVRARRGVAVVFMRDAALALSEEPYGWDGRKIAEHAGVGKKLIWQQQAAARAARERARNQR